MARRFNPYPEYKVSSVERLGSVPLHWHERRFKYSLRLLTEKAAQREYPIALENIESWTGRLITTEAEFQGEGVAFEEGDILFGKLRPYLAKAYRAERAGEAVGDFHVLRPLSEMDGRYAQYNILTREFITEVDGSTYGSKMPRASWEFVGAMETSVPPLPEQQKIADFLDYETVKIDRLIAKQQQLIELLKEKRQAVISHAVTKGLNPNAPLKPSGVEWLGDVPAHWKSTAIKYCAKPGYKTFVDGDWIESPYITTDGVRLLQTGNVGIGEFREKGFRYISSETFGKLNCTEVDPGDVLICRLDGPVGRACVAPDLSVRMITSVDNAILKCSDDHDAKYLVYALSSNEWLDWVKDLCRVGGGFRFRVSRSLLGDQRIPIPPIEEQKSIRDHLRTLDKRFKKLSKTAATQIQLLQERRTALISAAVTGKIDVRDWQAPSTPDTEGAA